MPEKSKIEEEKSSIRRKGTYKMIFGFAVAVASPIISIFLISPATMVTAAGVGLLFTALAAKSLEHVTQGKKVPDDNRMTFSKVAGKAAKFIGTYGTKTTLIGLAMMNLFSAGVTLMVEGAGNVITGRDTVGIIPAINYVSQKAGKIFEVKLPNGTEYTPVHTNEVEVKEPKNPDLVSETQKAVKGKGKKVDSSSKRSFWTKLVGEKSSNSPARGQ